MTQQVFIRGENRPFGDLTTDAAGSRADELWAATGWAPVAAVAFAWRELATIMQRDGAATVRELWVVLPRGSADPSAGAEVPRPVRERSNGWPECCE